MKKILVAPIMISAVFLHGCTTISTEQRPIGSSETRTFRTVATDPDTDEKISINAINNALRKSAHQSSAYRDKFRQWTGYGYATKGVEVTTGQDQSFTVYYLNNYESLIRHTSGKFNIKTSENANDVIAVDVVCPDSVVVYDSFKIVGDSQWLSHDKIATDLASICKKLNIEINRTKYERSELNVKYPADSVFANFERTLEGIRPNEIIQTTDIEKSKNFWLTHGDKRLQVAISVFPYRQGSKVIYGFFYPYAIKGDGTHTYSAAEIADIHRTIESIAND